MKPVVITVNGTGVADPWGPGFAGDVGRGCANLYDDIYAQFMGPQFASKFVWQPVGYPAAVYPMQSSVDVGVAEVCRLIDVYRGRRFALSGYSQGALVTNIVWRDHILKGEHANRRSDLMGIVNFGDPMRTPGIARGNAVAGLPQPKRLDGHVTGGIAGPGCLTAEQTPDFLLSCALDGDLYAAAPVGDDPWRNETEVGHDETLIFDAVMAFDGSDFIALAREVAEILTMPWANLVPLIQAIWNGLVFAAAGPSAPHWQYGPFVAPMVDWLLAKV